MKIPERKHSIENLIDAYQESMAKEPRAHLGVSSLGHFCDRWLWLSFRWAVIPKLTGRTLRIFRRGLDEETTMRGDLRDIGIVFDDNDHQVDFGAHVHGTPDGVILSGVPEAPKKPHVVEFKTHNLKSFKRLVEDSSDDIPGKGIAVVKPEHYVQMQCYMHGLKIDRALYMAVCKDDDRIYTERVRYNREVAEKAIARGRRLALEDEMPPPISTDPSWWQCKMCDAHEFCHETKLTQEINCRTCAHSTAKEDSTWRCERHEADDIPVDFQRTGCDCHVLHPDLVPWERKDGPDEWTAVYLIKGCEVSNGEPDATTYASREILANPTACTDPEIMKFRADTKGEIVK